MTDLSYLLKADGSRVELNERPDLARAQALVGGFIELATGVTREGQQVMLVCDEEGLLKKKPTNHAASCLHSRALGRAVGLVGDVIVLAGKYELD